MTLPETAGYGIVANVLWDRVLRMGAKVFLLGYHGDFESVCVRGLSKGGRPIKKYLPLKRLRSFRAAWFPPALWDQAWLRCPSRADAERRAAGLEAYWHDVRFCTTEGVVLREGLSVGEAGARWLTTMETLRHDS